MITLEKYLEYIDAGEIPPEPPRTTSIGGHNWGSITPNEFQEMFDARSFCRTRGLWTVIDQRWTKQLALWINGRTVLEVMAGGGWLAKALSEYYADITATDRIEGWETAHHNMRHVYPITRMGAVVAVDNYCDRDLLLICWPPHKDRTTIAICDAWGTDRPIIYIGDPAFAPDGFMRRFKTINPHPLIPLFSWPGMHDRVMIGHWRDK